MTGRISTLSAGLAACVLAVSSAYAGTGAEGYFTIYNDTPNNVVVGFYTNDGNGWSNNWLGDAQILPGQNGTAQFDADTGACDQLLAVGWLGSDGNEVVDEPISIDICDASNLYLGDNEINYD